MLTKDRKDKFVKNRAIFNKRLDRIEKNQSEEEFLDEFSYTYTNLNNYVLNQKRASWKHREYITKFQYRKLINKYVGQYVAFEKNNKILYGIILGITCTLSHDFGAKQHPFDDELFKEKSKSVYVKYDTLSGIAFSVFDIFNPKIEYKDIDINLSNIKEHLLTKSKTKEINKFIDDYYRKHKKLSQGKIYKDNTCSICLDDYSKIKEINLTCGHCFHKKCIEEWTKESILCPLCKKVSFLNLSFNAVYNTIQIM